MDGGKPSLRKVQGFPALYIALGPLTFPLGGSSQEAILDGQYRQNGNDNSNDKPMSS
jgi:hypothetical protein